MLNLHRACAVALACATAAAPMAARAECKLLQIAEFKLDPKSRSPIVAGAINGHPIKVLLDTGASFSMITRDEADRLGLPLAELEGVRAYGIGGDRQVYDAHIDHLQVGDLSKSSVDISVVGERGQAGEADMVIGDNVLANADLEFDLAHDTIRLFEPKGCAAPQLVYWGAAYSQAELMPWNYDAPAIQTRAYLNGKPVLAELDSGAGVSLIDAITATAAGVARPPAEAKPETIHGLGPRPGRSWTGRFDSFALGDEKIAHVNIQVMGFAPDVSVTDIGSNVPHRLNNTPSMFIGDDFLRAHRVFVDNQDHLILFSYQGGPVFSAPPVSEAAASR